MTNSWLSFTWFGCCCRGRRFSSDFVSGIAGVTKSRILDVVLALKRKRHRDFSASSAFCSSSLYLNYFFCSTLGFTASTSDAFCSNSLCILPPCLKNFRVGENSPNLCPTISSFTFTLIKVLPLCTPNVKPTISGIIVESRDQVLIIVESPTLRRPNFFRIEGWI